MNSRFSKSRSYQQIFSPPAPANRYPNHLQQQSSPERQTPNSRGTDISDYQSTMQQANEDDDHTTTRTATRTRTRTTTTTTTTPLRGINSENIPLYVTQSTRMIQQSMAPDSPSSSTSNDTVGGGEALPLNERIDNTDNIVYELSPTSESPSSSSAQSDHPQNIFRERVYNESSTEEDSSPSSSRRLEPNRGAEDDRTKNTIQTASSSTSGTTTKLHRMCRTMLSFGDILLAKSILSSEDAYHDKNSASIKDDRGATPLHVLAWNKALAEKICAHHHPGESSAKGFSKLYPQSSFDSLEQESNLRKEVVKLLVHDLLPANPKATIQVDNDGFIPFQSGLADWVHTCQTNVRNAASRKSGRNATTMGRQVWESTSLTLTNAMKLAQGKATTGSQARLSVEDLEQGRKSTSGLQQAKSESECNTYENRVDGGGDVGNLVALSEHARFIFIMLSAIIERLEMNHNNSSSRQVSSSPRFGGNSSNQGGFERNRVHMRGLKKIEGAQEITTTIIEEGKQSILSNSHTGISAQQLSNKNFL